MHTYFCIMRGGSQTLSCLQILLSMVNYQPELVIVRNI